jgi:hypothetical protein
MNKKQQREELLKLKEKILEAGFDVLIPAKEDCNWLVFGYLNPKSEKEIGKVFYTQVSDFDSGNVSIKYKPSKEFGTGARIFKEGVLFIKPESVLYDLKIRYIVEFNFPFSKYRLGEINFYKDLKEYKKENGWIEYLEEKSKKN